MNVALLLLAYATLLATAGARALRRASWTERAPRLAIATWQTLTVSVVLSGVLAGLAMVVPLWQVSGTLANLLQACVLALRAQYAVPGGVVLALTGAVLAAGVIARTGFCLLTSLVHAAWERRRHRRALAIVGRHDARLGATIVDHPHPAAYCLPGVRRRVVLTTGALAALQERQLRAVLAHELAHVRGRHHLVLALAEALERAFPRVPAFRHGLTEVTRLIELLADDAASRASSRLTVAEALVALAEARTPAAALGAGGAAAARVRRLLRPHRPLGRVRTLFGSALAVLALAIPVVVAAGPAVAARDMNYCPLAGPVPPMSTSTMGSQRPLDRAASPVPSRRDVYYST